MVMWDFSGWAWNGGDDVAAMPIVRGVQSSVFAARRGTKTCRTDPARASSSRYLNDMTNVNSTDFLRVVDHAAAMNDRWLFLAAFCLLLLGCGVVIYWLVKQLQAVLAGHKSARDTHQIALTQIIATQNETALKLAVCIDRNTAAMEECTMELRRIRERE